MDIPRGVALCPLPQQDSKASQPPTLPPLSQDSNATLLEVVARWRDARDEVKAAEAACEEKTSLWAQRTVRTTVERPWELNCMLARSHDFILVQFDFQFRFHLF